MEPSYQFGPRLEEARRAAGLQIEDVTRQTKIPRSAIEALEADDFSAFSGPTYAKGFLIQYSEFLGVDLQQWVQALEPAVYIGGQGLQPLFHKGKAVAAKRTASRESSAAGMSFLAMTVLSLLIVAASYFGFQILNGKFNPPTVVEHEPPEQRNPPQQHESESTLNPRGLSAEE